MKITDNKDFIATFKEVVFQRRSWKKFKNQKIDDKTLMSLLETASHSPSSFGLEPWKVLVISNREIKEKLEPICGGQNQVSTSSHLFVVLTYKSHMFLEDSQWMKERSMSKLKITNDADYHNFYQQNFLHFMKQINDWDQWAIRQSYILLENILLAATAHGLGSSPMEGIYIDKMIQFLETENLIKSEDKSNFNCPFVVAVGYKDEEFAPRSKDPVKVSDTFTIID